MDGLLEFMRVFQMRKRRESMGVACVQEHNLSPDLEAEAHEKAKLMGCTLVISFWEGGRTRLGEEWGLRDPRHSVHQTERDPRQRGRLHPAAG